MSLLSIGTPTTPSPLVSTFSIVAFDPTNGDLGIAVESKFLAVGAVVPWAKANVGAIATQAHANTNFGPNGLELLQKGLSAQEVLNKLVESDEGRDQRQVGIIDAAGNVAAYTGKKTIPWAGHKIGKNYSVQGNILVSEKVILEMSQAFESTNGNLAAKLLAALEAGQNAGGDSRGQQSAALLVVRERGGYSGFNDRYIDLRVDDHPEPTKELKRIYELYVKTFGVK